MASSPTTRKLRSRSKATNKAIDTADADADDNASALLTDQLEDLAFTTTGWAYEHGIIDREERAEITALIPTSTNYDKQIQRWATQPEPFYPARPSIKSTEAERQPAEPTNGTLRYLLVGFIPPFPRRRPIGIRKPSETIKRTDEPPLRVVVPFAQEMPTGGCKLYVLINPKDGLCKPYLCNQKQVFYLREFRDNESAAKVRKTSWNKRVLSVSVTVPTAVPSIKQTKFARARETLKAIVDPTPDFHNDIVHLTASFALYREPEILKQLKKKLELSDEDLADRRLPSYPNLRSFTKRPQVLKKLIGGSLEVMHDDASFGEEQAQGVVDEAASQWEDVKLTIETVLFLRQGLVESEIALEYRFLRGFLAHGSDMFDQRKMSNQGQPKQEDDPESKQHSSTSKMSEPRKKVAAAQNTTEGDLEDQTEIKFDAKELVTEAYHNVKRIIGEVAPSRLSIEMDQYGALMSSTIKRLKTIVTATKKYTDDLRGLNGDQLYAETLPDIWESFNNSIDVDLAKAAFGQAVRYAIAELASANQDCGDMVEQLVVELSRLGLDF